MAWIGTEGPKLFLSDPNAILNYLHGTDIPEENVYAAAQHITNKMLDGLKNVLRFRLAYKESDV
jgi:hypothetical protein